MLLYFKKKIIPYYLIKDILNFKCLYNYFYYNNKIKFSNFFTTFRVIYVGMKNVSMFFVVGNKKNSNNKLFTRLKLLKI